MYYILTRWRPVGLSELLHSVVGSWLLSVRGIFYSKLSEYLASKEDLDFIKILIKFDKSLIPFPGMRTIVYYTACIN